MKKIIFTLLVLVATSSFAHAGVDGKYVYKESGFKGTMDVKTTGSDVHVDISTINLKNGSDCGFEAKGKLKGDVLNLTSKDEYTPEPNKISIKFNGKTANVKAIQMINACGMGGLISGKYVKK